MFDKEPIGLLAGAGQFPIHIARKARAHDIPVVCLGIHDAASEELCRLTDRFYWTGVARLGKMIRCFKREGVKRIVMAGKVQKTVMYTPLRFLRLLPDWRFIKFWFFSRRKDNRDDSILLGVIEQFAKDGMTFAPPFDLCPELLVKPGVLTKRKPTTGEWSDIQFGWDLAKEMGRLDVGQSVCVKEKAVLAVEAIEGTDRCIQRAGELCRSGEFTVVKLAKPQQDMRFDVPTIGTDTIENIHRARGKVLAIEADKTIVVHQEETVALANKYGIAIVSVENRATQMDAA